MVSTVGQGRPAPLKELGGPGWHWARHAVRNAVCIVLTQRLCITAGVDKCQLRPSTIGSEMRACRFMDNRGLVASPGHAAAYSQAADREGTMRRRAAPPISVLCMGSARRAFAMKRRAAHRLGGLRAAHSLHG